MILHRAAHALLLASLLATFTTAVPVDPRPYSDIHSETDPHYVNKKWKDDKKHVDDVADRMNSVLEVYSTLSTKPKLESPSTVLKDGHNQMKKWQEFYKSEQGKKFDPKGRRMDSAKQRATFANEVENGIKVLYIPQHPVYSTWEDQAKAVGLQSAQAKSRYEEASRLKKATYGKPKGQMHE